MRKLIAKTLAVLPAFALATGAASAESNSPAEDEMPRALSLVVNDGGASVEIELVAQSQTTQRVKYAVLLSGTNNSRHSGNSQISAGERHVLTKLKTSVSGSWCASVDVTEESGASYTLTAGDCAHAA